MYASAQIQFYAKVFCLLCVAFHKIILLHKSPLQKRVGKPGQHQQDKKCPYRDERLAIGYRQNPN
jgi:hypothetical protein